MSAKPVGTFCWADLVPSDQARAIAFYSGLLGWAAEPGPAEYGGYATARIGGGEGEAAAGVTGVVGGPPLWTLYLATDDLDATLQRVPELGGAVLMGPQDIPAVGRMAIATEPTGAAFGLWQAGPFAGFEAFGRPQGALCWGECYSTDAAATRDFFASLLGLEPRTIDESADFTYYAMAVASNPEDRQNQFGVMQIAGPAAGLTPTFRPYISVDDIEASTARAAELGATVVDEPADSPFGRASTVVDPEGLTISLIQLGDRPGD